MEQQTTSPANAVTTSKEPPPENPEAIRLRTKVVFSFWTVILLLGLPTWWKTTSIYRAELPLQDMLDWADGVVFASRETLTTDCRLTILFSIPLPIILFTSG